MKLEEIKLESDGFKNFFENILEDFEESLSILNDVSKLSGLPPELKEKIFIFLDEYDILEEQ